VPPIAENRVYGLRRGQKAAWSLAFSANTCRRMRLTASDLDGAADNDPIYENAGWNFIMGKNLNPNLNKPKKG